MTDEVLVAIEALRAGGAERISVGDWHMVGTNVERDCRRPFRAAAAAARRLPPGATSSAAPAASWRRR